MIMMEMISWMMMKMVIMLIVTIKIRMMIRRRMVMMMMMSNTTFVDLRGVKRIRHSITQIFLSLIISERYCH